MQVLNAFNYIVDAVISLLNVFMHEKIGAVNGTDIFITDLYVSFLIICITIMVVRRLKQE